MRINKLINQAFSFIEIFSLSLTLSLSLFFYTQSCNFHTVQQKRPQFEQGFQRLAESSHLHCLILPLILLWEGVEQDEMGVANKAWRCGGGGGGGVLVNNIILQQQKQKQKLQQSPHHYWTYLHLGRRQAVPWTVVCGLLLFSVALISLFTGHVASDLEWYSNRFVKPTWYKKVREILSFNPHCGEFDCFFPHFHALIGM